MLHLTQLAGEFILVHPRVIDLGRGKLKSALLNLRDSDFVARREPAAQRQNLVKQYVAAFREVERAKLDQAKTTLKDLAANAASSVATEPRVAFMALLDAQLARLK